ADSPGPGDAPPSADHARTDDGGDVGVTLPQSGRQALPDPGDDRANPRAATPRPAISQDGGSSRRRQELSSPVVLSRIQGSSAFAASAAQATTDQRGRAT